jgi:hypothetical protein
MGIVSEYKIWITDPNGVVTLLGAAYSENEQAAQIEMGKLIRRNLHKLHRDSLAVLTRPDGSEVVSSHVSEHEL